MDQQELDTRARFRRVMGKFATGVTVLSYLRDGESTGMTANAFLSVSLDPQLVLVSIRNASRFCGAVRAGDRFGINFLGCHQESLSARFAGQAQDTPGVLDHHPCGTPYLPESIARLLVQVVDIHPAGDHQLYVAQVLALDESEQADPLLFFGGRYGRLAVAECAS